MKKLYIGIGVAVVELILLSIAGVLIYQMFNTVEVKTILVEAEPIVVEEEVEEVTDVSEIEEVVEPQIKSDIQVIAEVVMSEAGNQEMIGKVAVAITLLNRMDATGKTAESIALEAYSYPYYGVVTSECYRAVEIAMNNRDLFPDDMMYFRTLHYHDFGVPYMQIQDHYFSTKE